MGVSSRIKYFHILLVIAIKYTSESKNVWNYNQILNENINLYPVAM